MTPSEAFDTMKERASLYADERLKMLASLSDSPMPDIVREMLHREVSSAWLLGCAAAAEMLQRASRKGWPR